MEILENLTKLLQYSVYRWQSGKLVLLFKEGEMKESSPPSIACLCSSTLFSVGFFGSGLILRMIEA